MGVYIKGMEMPRSCAECPVNMNICKRGYKFLLNHMELYDQRANDCPISSVPPHGRLVDADALMKQVEHDTPLSDVFEKTMRRYLHNAPTIIEAEEGE